MRQQQVLLSDVILSQVHHTASFVLTTMHLFILPCKGFEEASPLISTYVACLCLPRCNSGHRADGNSLRGCCISHVQDTFKYSLLLGFWTLSIVQISTNKKTQRFGNWICFHPQARGGHLLYKKPKAYLTTGDVRSKEGQPLETKRGYKHLTAGRVHGM
jgi:hypothetical protein